MAALKENSIADTVGEINRLNHDIKELTNFVINTQTRRHV